MTGVPIVTHILEPAHAGRASTAGKMNGHGDPLAWGQPLNAAPNGFNDAADFVTENSSFRKMNTIPDPVTVPDMPIGSAYTGGDNSDQRVLLPDLGHWHIRHLDR
jgi:hypothetical protein